MERSNKVIIPTTRPISEGWNKGNTNTRPTGQKPAASPKPETATGNGTAQGISPQGTSLQGTSPQGTSSPQGSTQS